MAQFILSAEALERNGRILRAVAEATGARMLVALKAFSTAAGLDILKEYADGCCASGLYEAKLGAQHVGGHIAVYSPAYTEADLRELLAFVHHIDFNSLPQWQRLRDICLRHPRVRSGEVQLGLRINPCCSTGSTPMYDPCAPGSRLGIPLKDLRDADLTGISGLHLHTLCEQFTDDLLTTVAALEKQAAPLLSSPAIRYLNLGGGHWITQPTYDRPALTQLIQRLQNTYHLQIYLEPGEAWCIHSGVLRARVLDVFETLGYRHAILDVSVTAHMPDVLEMPYRPDVYCLVPSPGKAEAERRPAVCMPGEYYALAHVAAELPFTYRLGATTCLAGDVLGDYSFPHPLSVGDTLVLDDMAHYTTVKSTHFNGIPHPDIYLMHRNGTLSCVRPFTYRDFANVHEYPIDAHERTRTSMG